MASAAVALTAWARSGSVSARSTSVYAAALNTTVGRVRASSAPTAPASVMSHSARATAAATRHPARSSAGPSALPRVPRAPNTTATAIGRSGMGTGLGAGRPPRQRAAHVLLVGPDHHLDQALEADLRLPAEHAHRLARIAVQVIHLGRTEIPRIDLDVLLPVELERAERDVQHLAHAVRLAGGDDVIVGLVVLQHHPHRLDVVAREAPVALGVQVAEVQLLLQPVANAGGGPGDLAGDERDPAPRRFVVEEDAAGDEHPVRLAVVLGQLVGEHLGARVRAARLERRGLALGRLRAAEHLAGRRL